MNTPLDIQSLPLQRRSPAFFRGLWDTGGLIILYLLIASLCAYFVPNFFGIVNFQGLLLRVTTVGLIACTMMLCLAAGDFDLSVGSIVALSGVVACQTILHTGSTSLGVCAGVLSGCLVGLINGINIAYFKINALIATLVTMQAARGAAFLLAGKNGTSVSVSTDSFASLGISTLFGLSIPVWFMVASLFIFGFILNFTIFGRNTLAIGGNLEAARLSGVRVRLSKIAIFVIQGGMAGFAGTILSARMTLGDPKAGAGLELQVISACVLGGVSLTGGIATISGVIVGVLIMGTLENVMNLKQIDTYWQYVVSGSVLLLAVYIDKLKNRKRA